MTVATSRRMSLEAYLTDDAVPRLHWEQRHQLSHLPQLEADGRASADGWPVNFDTT